MTNLCTYVLLLLGTINFSNSYYVSNIQPNFQNISGSRRHSANGRCQIPNNAPNGKYRIRGDEANNYYREGDYVPRRNVLYLKCDGSYRPSPPEIVGSYCIDGVWKPQPSVCARTCKPIRSTETTKVQCFFNNLALENCDNPIDGTIAKFTCEPFYEEPSLENNHNRVCENGDWQGIPYCTPICGRKHPVARTNIINGTNAKLGDYPWHVGVYTDQKVYICGGSIITQRIILSAAHCFTNLATGELHPKENYLIAAGKYYRLYSDFRDEHYQYSTIESIDIPSCYRGIKFQFQADIAVVVLTEQLILTEAVQPVCVDWEDQFENQQLTPNSYGTVIGWGSTVEGLHLSEELKELSIPFISYNECDDSVPSNFQTFLRPDKICGGYLNSSTGVCAGDSGGGLTFPKRFTGRYFIRGIVSLSPAAEGGQCDSNQYGVYTLVSAYLDFIKDVLNKRRPMSWIPPVIAPSTTAPVSNLHCPIPYFSGYGFHTIQSSNALSNEKSYQVGDLAKADPFDILTSLCNNGQTSISTSSVCVDGSWRPKPRNCSDSYVLNLLPTKEVCGIFQASEEDSAINSFTEAAYLNEFPWLVTLNSYVSPWYFKHVCEGVLINNRYVLTAANCFTNDIGELNMARLGEYNLDTDPDCLNNGIRSICAPSPIDVPIAEYTIHEEYSNELRTNDIALIRLERAVEFTDYIKPICLPTSNNLINKNFENTVMTLAGWSSKRLLRDGDRNKFKLRVPVKATFQCAIPNNGTTNPKYICTELIRDPYHRIIVNGSVLVKSEQDGGRSNWYAFGILSTLTGRGNDITMIHSPVTSYIPWILSKIKP